MKGLISEKNIVNHREDIGNSGLPPVYPLNQLCDDQYGIKYIIGDKFYEFSKSNHVVSVSDFLNKMGEFGKFASIKQVYYFGQGVSFDEKKIITEYCIKHNISIFRNDKAADSAITHKLKQENIMITDPIKMGENFYRSNLLINDECAEMSDHVTGCHIQGMVLIEAARQMMLAVSEKFILGIENQGKSYCILNNVITSFNQFIFPIDVVMEHSIISLDTYRNGTYAVKCKTLFIQDNKIATEVAIEYKLYDKRFMVKKEEQIAEKCLQQSALRIRRSLLKDASN